VVVAQHRSQYSRTKSHPSDQFSSPSRTFRAINCRSSFQSGPTAPPSPPLTPDPPKPQQKRSKPININPKKLAKSNSEDLSPFAGPVYSNSPPPSSLPIPKFSLRQKRSVSLDLPVSRADVALRPIAKSAPSSPTGGSSGFSLDAAVATENLRRILRLDDE
jgi:hypothetical protein